MKIPQGYELRDFQVPGVEHLIGGRHKLLLDDMGLGKTVQSIVAFNTLGAKSVLIHCPPAVKWGWAKEIEEWSVGKYRVDVVEGMFHEFDPKAHITICPYNLLDSGSNRMNILRGKYAVGIADEIQFLKEGSSNRTANVFGRRPGRAGPRITGTFSRCYYRWGLTGTLMLNRPVELFYVLRTMGAEYVPEKYLNYIKYANRFCGRYKTLRGWDVKGATNLDELSSLLFDSGFALRRTKKEVLKDLPPCIIKLLPVKNGTVGAETINKVDLKAPKLGISAGEMATLRKDTALEKLKECVTYIKEQLESHEKIVIFCWTREIVSSIMRELKQYKPVDYYGATTTARKEINKKAFIEEEEVRLFVANISSAGTGLNGLQHVCSKAIFVESDWTPSGTSQAVARLERMGQEENVSVDILFAQGTLEEYILRKAFDKEKRIDKLMRH